MSEILVSICCITYNHQDYIEECLGSFLNQQCNFKFEILIHDDASTDGTAKIIKQYQHRFPEIIFPIFQSENQYSQGTKNIQSKFNLTRARGRYIAMCEGDDYWLNSFKLEMQVAFLERHPDYSLCVGGYIKREVETNKKQEIIRNISDAESSANRGFTFTLDTTKKGWLTKTLTALYRKDSSLIEKLSQYKYGRDINLFYHLLKDGGKGFYFQEILGVYNVHEGGVNSMKKGRINNNEAYKVYKELYEVNKDEFSRYKYIRSTLNLLNYDLFHNYPENNFKKKAGLLSKAISLVRTSQEMQYVFSAFLPENIKSKYRNRKVSSPGKYKNRKSLQD